MRFVRFVLCYFTTKITNPTNVGCAIVTNYHELTMNLVVDNSCDSCDSCCVISPRIPLIPRMFGAL